LIAARPLTASLDAIASICARCRTDLNRILVEDFPRTIAGTAIEVLRRVALRDDVLEPNQSAAVTIAARQQSHMRDDSRTAPGIGPIRVPFLVTPKKI
jgi:hypothetical protein